MYFILSLDNILQQCLVNCYVRDMYAPNRGIIYVQYLRQIYRVLFVLRLPLAFYGETSHNPILAHKEETFYKALSG